MRFVRGFEPTQRRAIPLMVQKAGNSIPQTKVSPIVTS